MKKEKLLIQHPTDPLSTQELPIPPPLFDERSMNLSEKEIIDLFEKMMVSVLFTFCWHCILAYIALEISCIRAPPRFSVGETFDLVGIRII